MLEEQTRETLRRSSEQTVEQMKAVQKKQKKQKGEPGMRTAIFPENGRRMMSEMMCMCRCMCMSCMCCGKEKCAPDVSV